MKKSGACVRKLAICILVVVNIHLMMRSLKNKCGIADTLHLEDAYSSCYKLFKYRTVLGQPKEA